MTANLIENIVLLLAGFYQVIKVEIEAYRDHKMEGVKVINPPCIS